MENLSKPATISAPQIMKAQIPEVPWIIPEIVPDGITMLAGKPKSGKSLLALDMALAVSKGLSFLADIPVEKKGVLNLALEDSNRRIKTRMKKMLSSSAAPEQLRFALEWPSFDVSGIEQLEQWLRKHRSVKFIIVDTLARVTGARRLGSNYQADYNLVTSLQVMAQRYQAAVLLVHHLRKSEADDLLDCVLGSTGLTAAVDNFLILKRAGYGSGSILHVRGRDVQEMDLALELDQQTGRFSIAGPAEKYTLTPERRELVELLSKTEGPMRLNEIADAIKKKRPVVRKLLEHLLRAGLVEQPKYGFYQLNGKHGKCDETGETGETEKSNVTYH